MREVISCNDKYYEDNKVKYKDRNKSRVWSYFGMDGQERFLRIQHLSCKQEGVKEPGQKTLD